MKQHQLGISNRFVLIDHSVSLCHNKLILFKSEIPPTNEFNLGEKLECIDPRNPESWCIGTVITKAGPRIRIRLDGTDDRNDFWRLVDSVDIRPYGATERLVRQMKRYSAN